MPARTLLLLAALLGGSSMALPGQATTPQALGVSVNVRANDVGRLVLIQRAVPSQVEVFQSRAGQQHLRFKASIDGQTYAAIMYSGDWTPADQARLGAGQVQLVGLWDTYANAPSLTVKKVLGGATRPVPPAGASGTAPLLKIAGAQIHVANIQKYSSAAQKMHVTYTFAVNGKSYQGVMYAGTWSTPSLSLLRSGGATLYGRWGTYQGKPNFVTERVGP